MGLAEARQMVLLSTQDSGQLGYWPDRNEEYPIDPKIWIAKHTYIENGIEYKDFQNLMTRFKYSPDDPLEYITLEEITPKGKGRKGKNITRSQSAKNTNTDSPAVSETVTGDTPPDNEKKVSVIVVEDQNKAGTDCIVSKEVKTNHIVCLYRLVFVYKPCLSSLTGEFPVVKRIDSFSSEPCDRLTSLSPQQQP